MTFSKSSCLSALDSSQDMEITSDGEAAERRRELWKLLSSLKTTVEGLLSTNNPNVWSRYGGLQRLHKDMNNILSHGLKNEQVYYKQRDYWPFVWFVRHISPHLASHVEQFSKLEPVVSSRVQSAGESYKAERWLLYSLQVHMLSAQLKPLLRRQGHAIKYYNDAFLLSESHVNAMFQCLEAVEQNNPKLLAQIDTVGLSPLKNPPCLGLLKSQSLCVLPGAGGPWRSPDSTPKRESLNRRLTTSNCSLRDVAATNTSGNMIGGSISTNTTSRASSRGLPGMCLTRPEESERGVTPPPGQASVPSISLLASPSLTSPQPDTGDSGDGEYDDGPEYLAIGNLGQRSRCSTQSSTHSSELSESKDQSLQPNSLGLPPLRRSSFSEGQRELVKGSRGHTRSFSDTGIVQKLRKGGAHRKITIIIEDPVAETESEDRCSKEYSPFSLQPSDTSTSTSLYTDPHGSQYSRTPDGLFRKPSKGQSLISYLSEQDFGSCADLEKENAHFSISESLIAAIELMKYNLRRQQEEGEEEGDSDSEIQQLKQKIRLRRQQIRRSRLPPCMTSQHLFHSTDSSGSRRSSQDSHHGLSDSDSAEEVEECELRDGCEGQSLLAVSQNGLSLSLASLFSEADIKRSVSSSNKSFLSSESISTSFLQSNSAESVAMGLLRQFEGMQLPAASELDWLVPEHDAPQKLLPIPDSLPISPDDGEHADIYKLRIRVRGNLEWAPPRPQIIFNIHPPPKRKIVAAKQNYRCAGCGTRIDPDYIKRLRYCEYLGRYFCQCCHENAQVVVPGRILMKWDFGKYYVSNFARDLLTKIAGDPLFNPNDINSALYKKVKALESVRVLRMQLFHMKTLFRTCRFSKEVLEQFDSLPCHLTEDLHLFSLNDLLSVRNGELAPRMKELLKLGTVHVAGCVLCQAKGFVCEFCGNEKDIIFPFQLSKCQRCEGEPSLLVAGLGGLRVPPRRSSAPVIWIDWKLSKPRRLARALSKDRHEGEGGEEDLESVEEEETDRGGQEKSPDNIQARKAKAGLFRHFSPGKLTKAFTWHHGTEEEQEVTTGSESEKDGEKGSEERDAVFSKDRPKREEGEEGHAKRISLLKILRLERLKQSLSKHDRTDSDSETCSSQESSEEVVEGQRSKERWFGRLGRTFSKGDPKDGKTKATEEEKHEEPERRSPEPGGGTVEVGEGKAMEESEGKAEKLAVSNVPKQSAAFSQEPSMTDDGQVDSAPVQTNWRARKTRRARRITRGRQSFQGRDGDGGQ
ncbi:run domain Beclin-1-interacting and cysteine-rich domain-containing protein isoform X2 [Hippocampus zosterae]|uniref:run domain Beclin-1-interacting and cysteine-rich domain-containing protein isoform X2 n=1 Tax=Hippocampus zosterae TaxID=109293 RepID=UPI00223E36AD|nr:run domain Beclin-1-interacting and cysteine-rich domain-containing protein isoform X2 [Hippocampus zosterae]